MARARAAPSCGSVPAPSSSSEDQRVRVAFAEDADYVLDMPRKCRKGLFNGLLVADVGKDLVEDADLRAGFGWDVQASLSHQSQQPHRF